MAQTIKVLDLLNLKNWDQCTSSYIKSPLSIQEPASINSNNLNGTQIEIFLIQSAITNFIFPWPNEAQTSSTIYLVLLYQYWSKTLLELFKHQEKFRIQAQTSKFNKDLEF